MQCVHFILLGQRVCEVCKWGERGTEGKGGGHDHTLQAAIWALALVSFIGHMTFGKILNLHSFTEYFSKIFAAGLAADNKTRWDPMFMELTL